MKLMLLSLLFLSLPSFGALTLKEAFDASRKNMETIKRADAQLTQAMERKKQARASFFPDINAVANKTWIDAPDNSGVNQAFVLTEQHSSALRLTQPLLRGGSVSAYQVRKEEELLARFQKDATELNLYQLVIRSYYDLYLAKVDLKNLAELLRLSEERVKEIRDRTKIGRSRKGELVQAETQLLTAKSQFSQGEINLREAERTFEFFTKLESKELSKLPVLPKDLPSLTSYMDKLKNRPDLAARRQEVIAAEGRVATAKGGHWPSLDLVANQYIDRTGVLETSDWDLALVVNVPLFQGGEVQAQVREQVAAKRVAELNSSETLRAARRDLAILYQSYMEIQTQLQSLKAAVKKAEEAWRLNRQDYRYGQVTNLEVLQSLNLYIETKRSYDALLASAHMTYHNLEASIGVLP